MVVLTVLFCVRLWVKKNYRERDITRNMILKGTNSNWILRRVKEPCLYIFFSHAKQGQLTSCKNGPSAWADPEWIKKKYEKIRWWWTIESRSRCRLTETHEADNDMQLRKKYSKGRWRKDSYDICIKSISWIIHEKTTVEKQNSLQNSWIIHFSPGTSDQKAKNAHNPINACFMRLGSGTWRQYYAFSGRTRGGSRNRQKLEAAPRKRCGCAAGILKASAISIRFWSFRKVIKRGGA